MVNIGRPSKGCLTCRRRRVKCDETRPNCNRCTKMQTNCEWQNDWNAMVRPQEKWAKEKVAQRVERVQTLRNQKESTGPSADDLLKAVLLPKQPQIGPEIFAINRFYTDYAFTIASCQFLYLVQPMWGKESTPHSLQSIVPAVALANVAKKLGRHDLMEQSRRHYGQALKKMARSLTTPEVARHDGTLLTAIMLGVYETISFDRASGAQIPYIAHTSGRLALLKLRGPKQLETASGRNLFIVLHHEQLVASLMTESEPDEELHSWIYGSFPMSPIITLMLLMHDTSSFLFLLKKVLGRTPKASSAEVTTLLDIGLRLHELALDLVQFFISGDAERSETIRFYTEADAKRKHSNQNKATVPNLQEALKANETAKPKTRKESGPKTAEGIPISEAAGPEVVHVKDHLAIRHDSANAAHLNTTRLTALSLCRAMHICLLQGLLKAIRHLRSNPCPSLGPNDNEPSLDNIASLEHNFDAAISQHAVGINCEVPRAIDGEAWSASEYTLRGNAFRAYVLLWPLRTALNASQTENRYKVLLARRLTEINKVHGIGMAVEMVAMAKDLPSDDGVQDDGHELRREGYVKVGRELEAEQASCHSRCFCFFKH